jgi:hypothetical protein
MSSFCSDQGRLYLVPERKLGFFVKIKEDDPALAGLTTGILVVF